MENAERVRSYCERKGIRPVPICGIDEFPLVLDGADGRRYSEVRGNVWMDVAGEGDVAYVGTSRHGGHITLRRRLEKRDDRRAVGFRKLEDGAVAVSPHG